MSNMATFTFDAYSRFTKEALKQRCRELCRISMKKDIEIERLLAALTGIAEYCSGDDRTLGAIARLAAIRNTADQAVRAHGQGAATCATRP